MNKKPGKSLIVPLGSILDKEPEYKVQTERPRPSPRTLPKIENSQQPKSDSPLHTSFALSFNNNQQNPRVVARTRASTTTSNARRGSTLDLLPNVLNSNQASNRFKPPTTIINNQNGRARLSSRPLVQPSIIVTPPSTTTTTTTPAPFLPPKPANDPRDPKSNSDYIYDYVYEDQPGSAPPSSNSALIQNKPLPPPLPSIPTLEDAQPNRNANAVTTTNTNLGSLFSSSIGGPSLPKLSGAPQSISAPTQQRPPQQRNQPLPQTNFFASNPFASSNNPFSSNPFVSNPFSSNHNGPSLVRQKRDDKELTKELLEEDEFNCFDKLPGIGYTDIKSKCKMFHICLPLSKGKYKDYQLFCESGSGYNQYTASCEPLDKFDCKRSKSFYLYNKQFNNYQYLKNKYSISKQLADIKAN